MDADQFIKDNKVNLIKFLEKSRDTIVSQKEDDTVKDLIKNINDISDRSKAKEDYNIYMEDPFDQHYPVI